MNDKDKNELVPVLNVDLTQMLGRIIGKDKEGLCLCRVGGYIITIPKEWVKENMNLNKGDLVNFEDKEGPLYVVVKEALEG